jgi:hypothetical protein
MIAPRYCKSPEGKTILGNSNLSRLICWKDQIGNPAEKGLEILDMVIKQTLVSGCLHVSAVLLQKDLIVISDLGSAP